MFDKDIMKSVKISIGQFCKETFNNYDWDYPKLQPHISHFGEVWVKDKMWRFIDKDTVTVEQLVYLKQLVSEKFDELYFSKKAHSSNDQVYLSKFKDNLEHNPSQLDHFGYREYLLKKLRTSKNGYQLYQSGKVSVKGFLSYYGKSAYNTSKYYFHFKHYSWGLKDSAINITFDDEELYKQIETYNEAYATITILVTTSSFGKVYYTLCSIDAIEDYPFWCTYRPYKGDLV